MKKLTAFIILSVSLTIASPSASHSGPFLFWGLENLNDIKIPTLQPIDDKALRDIYSSASSIVIFVRNSTTQLNYINFPKLSAIIGTSGWIYLPQEQLPTDPLEYKSNAEVFVLTGTAEQQDNEIVALYRNSQVNLGKKNILGILATQHHSINKREAYGKVHSKFIYEAIGKGILYTTKAPILKIRSHNPNKDVFYKLEKFAIVTADEGRDEFRLNIKFIVPEKSITVKFLFRISVGRWSLKQAAVEIDGKNTLLDAVGEHAAAPLGFSYACGGLFIFGKEAISLTLNGIQVQPMLRGAKRFSKAYDCVGFMSPAILAGLFVTFILGIVITLAITAILDIKTPNKFESRNAKQLTFTAQE